MILRVLPTASNEIDRAERWYEAQKSGLGTGFYQTVLDALAEIKRQPFSFASAVSSNSRRDIRAFPLKSFPYSIKYEIVNAQIVVLAVAHHKRRPDYWRRRRANP